MNKRRANKALKKLLAGKRCSGLEMSEAAELFTFNIRTSVARSCAVLIESFDNIRKSMLQSREDARQTYPNGIMR